MGAGARVIIGDDHLVIAEALAMLLEAQGDIEVVGVAGCERDVLALVDSRDADVVVLDYQFGDDDGIELTRRLKPRAPHLRVLLLTCHDTVRVASLAMRAGAAGFVLKQAASEELVRAIRAVSRGETWVSPGILGPLLDELIGGNQGVPTTDARIAQLSKRELEILRCMVGGYSRAAISRMLFLSANTVRTHIRNILAKLDVHTSLEAVAVAVRAGVPGFGDDPLVTPEPLVSPTKLPV